MIYQEEFSIDKKVFPRIRRHLGELALGGTAVGTGLNAPREFGSLAVKKIAQYTRIPFVQAKNPFQAIAARDTVVEASTEISSSTP